MHIFFSVGEPSGDQHAAHLICELKRRVPGLQVSALGGPEMEAAGCRNLFQLTQLAVMGVLRVLPLIFKFWSVYRMAKKHLQATRPDLVVLVDFPGFNWWIAAAAKKLGIPVVYFMPPQLWAWGPWRVKRVHKYVTHVLSGLRFETDWYAKQGVPVTYVGHPFFDEVAKSGPVDSFRHEWRNPAGQTVAILPGSRSQEVSGSWPILLEVMDRVAMQNPDVRFLVASYKPHQMEKCRAAYEASGMKLPIDFFTGKTSEIINISDCGLMVSGSVSLEFVAAGTPAITFYTVSPVTRWFAHRLITAPFIALPNLMAGRAIMPEYFVASSERHLATWLARDLNAWLANPQALESVKAEFDQLRKSVYETGATTRAASAILKLLNTTDEERLAA